MDITPPTIIPLDATQIVPVDRDLLARASAITGQQNPAELVRFALQMLAHVESIDVMRELRGELPSAEPDV